MIIFLCKLFTVSSFVMSHKVYNTNWMKHYKNSIQSFYSFIHNLLLTLLWLWWRYNMVPQFGTVEEHNSTVLLSISFALTLHLDLVLPCTKVKNYIGRPFSISESKLSSGHTVLCRHSPWFRWLVDGVQADLRTFHVTNR